MKSEVEERDNARSSKWRLDRRELMKRGAGAAGLAAVAAPAAAMAAAQEQRGQADKVWGNVSALSDIGIAIKTLANFGQPKPL